MNFISVYNVCALWSRRLYLITEMIILFCVCCRHAIKMFEKFTTGNPDDELKRSMSSSALMACSSSLGQNPPFQGSDSESNFFSYTSSFCHTYIYSHRMILILQNFLTKKEAITVDWQKHSYSPLQSMHIVIVWSFVSLMFSLSCVILLIYVLACGCISKK